MSELDRIKKDATGMEIVMENICNFFIRRKEKKKHNVFNINSKVKIKITDAGKDILDKENAELKKQYPRIDFGTAPAKPESHDGWQEWQLWEVMSTFGPYMCNGALPPFETDIVINVDQIKA